VHAGQLIACSGVLSPKIVSAQSGPLFSKVQRGLMSDRDENRLVRPTHTTFEVRAHAVSKWQRVFGLCGSHTSQTKNATLVMESHTSTFSTGLTNLGCNSNSFIIPSIHSISILYGIRVCK
jgi:hypothetical protein